MDPLCRHLSQTEWYRKHWFYCLLIQEKKTNGQQNVRIRNVKLWLLKIPTLSTAQFTYLPQNTTECLLKKRPERKLTKIQGFGLGKWKQGRISQLCCCCTQLQLQVYPPPAQHSFEENPIADEKIRADLNEPLRRTVKPAAGIKSSFQRKI